MPGLRKLRSVCARLWRTPGFSLLAVATLALALGPGIALYAVVEAVLLEPLPYHQPDRLVAVWDANESVGWEKQRVTPSHYWIWREQDTVFEQVAIYGSATYTLQTDTDPIQIAGTRVSEEFFPLLGSGAAAGRVLAAVDYEGDAPAVAVISHALWSEVFGKDPNVLGRPLRLGDDFAAVVGVLAPDVLPVRAAASGRIDFDTSRPHVWVPFREVPDRRGSHVFGILGRLADGVTPQAAAARLDELAASRPETEQYTTVVVPLADELMGDVRGSLSMLLAAVLLLLVVAILNVSNLVVVRAAARTRELAVRTALGAGRWRLLGDGLLEGTVLTVIAGAAGLGLGALLLMALQARPPVDVPRLQDAAILSSFLRFGPPVLLLSSLLFALSALRSGGPKLLGRLASTGKGVSSTGASPRLRQVLVAAEVAVTVVLVIGSGLLLKSFAQLTAVEPGFRNTDVLTVDFLHTSQRYREMTELTGFYDNLLTRLEALPGVVSTAASYDHPMTSNWSQSFRPASGPDREEGGVALFRTVTPGYFETMGIGVLEGRAFRDGDDASAAGAVLINESMRRRYFPQGQALGQELEIGTTQWAWGDAIPASFTVVGVVEDVRFHGLDQASEPAFYLPYKQTPQLKMTVYLRSRTDLEGLLPAVRRELRQLDPELPIAGTSTMATVLSDAVAQPRFNLLLVTGFGSSALLLALVGLGGVLSYIARRRLHEIGIRLALGAQRKSVVSLLLRQGVGPAVVGLVLGTVVAVFLSRLAASLLFEVSPTDVTTYAAACGGLLVATVLACLGPALGASRLEPLEVLRSE